MASANVETVGQVIEAWNSRDTRAILDVTIPEAEYVNAPEAVEPGTRHGHAELSEVFRKQWEGLTEGAYMVVDEAFEDGDEVVTAGRVALRLHGSPLETNNRVAMRWTFRDGLIARLEILGGGSEFEPALKAAGITLDR